jgi:hypothetical protein
VPGEVRFGVEIRPAIGDALVISTVFIVTSKGLPGKALAIKLAQRGGIGR